MKKSKPSIVYNRWGFLKSFQYALLTITYYCFAIHASAQSVSASLDRDKILLGEQVTLQLDISNVKDGMYFVSSWPQLSDTIGHIEILKQASIDTIDVNGNNSYRQSFTITSFDSGRWQIGPFVFLLQDKFYNKKIQLKTDPLYLNVLPVNVSLMKEYHAIKEIIPVEHIFNWKPVIITIIAVLITAIIIFFFVKKNKNKPKTPAQPVLKGTALERALEKLHALEKQPLSSVAQIRNFHSEADFEVRKYFEEVLHINALQLTSAELFNRLNVYLQQQHLRLSLRDAFELNQSVKFAKYMPDEAESKNTLKEIIKGLNQIDDLVNIAKINAERMVSKY